MKTSSTLRGAVVGLSMSLTYCGSGLQRRSVHCQASTRLNSSSPSCSREYSVLQQQAAALHCTALRFIECFFLLLLLLHLQLYSHLLIFFNFFFSFTHFFLFSKTSSHLLSSPFLILALRQRWVWGAWCGAAPASCSWCRKDLVRSRALACGR